jgi:FkbM family methyltransferase
MSRPAVRAVARTVVGVLPEPVADVVRRPLPSDTASSLPGRIRLAMLRALREGGIPRSVSTFGLVDNPGLRFVAAESLVLAQLYWYGEQGWEPELLPWWRSFCRRSASVLELGANVGYFTVQAARAAPGNHHVAVEPHPFSVEICRANLAVNRLDTVELIHAAAVPGPGVRTTQLLVPADQLATPTVAFLSPDTELPTEMARGVPDVIDVPAIDVRALVEGTDLIKLDVEGQEHALLTACRDYLARRHPTVFVEVLAGTARLRTLLGDLCREDGYRCYAVTRARLVELGAAELATVRLEERFGSHDVVLCSGEPPQP